MGFIPFRHALIGASLLLLTNTVYSYESVPGEYVVTLKYGTLRDRAALSQELGGVVTQTIRENMVLVKRASQELDESGVRELSRSSLVEVAEPNYIYRASRMPNDADYGKLWGMHNSGQADSTGQTGITGVDIDAERAWDIATGSKKVIVAVIDTGIDFKIPDLASQAWTNTAELNGKAGVDDDANGYVDDIHGYNFALNTGDSTDDMGHGSHCSGTIGGRGNDGAGIAGVNWDISLMAVKFLGADGSGTLANAVLAIDYARKNGAMIMSNSWGGGPFTQALKAAIDDTNTAGILFVAAAGNNGANHDVTPGYPASYEDSNIISVAAIDNRGALASFSDFGSKTVDIAAPGVNIFSTLPSAISATGFDSWSGTSMATPHVTGVAALVLGSEPGLTAAQLKQRLLSTARPYHTLRGKVSTSGIVNAYYALTNTTPPADPMDPTAWTNHLPLSISSAHPYASNTAQIFQVNVPGATRFVLHFSSFDTEMTYDTVELVAADGTSLGKLSGTLGDSYSPTIEGDSITVRFTSDSSVDKNGFDIDYAAWE